MAYSDAARRATVKYQKENMVAKTFRFSRSTDADIIAQLEAQDNQAGYIKELIRADIEKSR